MLTILCYNIIDKNVKLGTNYLKVIVKLIF